MSRRKARSESARPIPIPGEAAIALPSRSAAPSLRRCSTGRPLCRMNPAPEPRPSISTCSSSAPAFPGSTPPIICRNAARASPGDPRGARRDRRDVGPVPLSRHPLRQRHVHFGLPVPAVDRGQGDRRRGGDPRLCRGDGAGIRHRPAHPLPPPSRPRASWSSAEARWTVEVEAGGRGPALHLRLPVPLQRLLRLCDQAIGREWPGEALYRGRIVHPQHWPEDLDHAGKRIVVIGSGATAVTLVPALAETAAHVTMLQRSPSYIVARPSRDGIAHWLQRRLPLRPPTGRPAGRTCCSACFFFSRARKRPERVGRRSLRLVDRGNCPPATTSSAISRPPTIPGTSASAWSPTAICSRR